METMLIISTFVAFLFTAVIWKAWKWFEFEAWIWPATLGAFCNALLLVAPALVKAAKALAEASVIMERARQQAVKHNLQPGELLPKQAKHHFQMGRYLSTGNRAKPGNRDFFRTGFLPILIFDGFFEADFFRLIFWSKFFRANFQSRFF